MRNEIYMQPYHSYTIKVFKSGTKYFGLVSYGGKVYYRSTSSRIDERLNDRWAVRYLLGHLKWWVRDRGNKKRTRGR